MYIIQLEKLINFLLLQLLIFSITNIFDFIIENLTSEICTKDLKNINSNAENMLPAHKNLCPFFLADISNVSDIRSLVNSPVSGQVEKLNISRGLGGTRLRRGVENKRTRNKEELRHDFIRAYFVPALISSLRCSAIGGEKERERKTKGVGTDKCSGNERKRRIESAGYRARCFACFGTGRVSDIYMWFAY